jgi:hypothetical protein
VNSNSEKYPWSRAQQFALSARGAELVTQYQEAIVASRKQEGRASFDAARAGWASAHQLQEDDGLYLSEFRQGPLNLKAVVDALADLEKRRPDAVSAVNRLVGKGLLSPL